MRTLLIFSSTVFLFAAIQSVAVSAKKGAIAAKSETASSAPHRGKTAEERKAILDRKFEKDAIVTATNIVNKMKPILDSKRDILVEKIAYLLLETADKLKKAGAVDEFSTLLKMKIAK